jgi:hypothetical protein
MPRAGVQPLRSGTIPAGDFPDLLPGGDRGSVSHVDPKRKSTSPPRRKTTTNTKSHSTGSRDKKHQHIKEPQVIDLSNEEDDILLSELLDDDAYLKKRQKHPLSPRSISTAATEDSPPTPGPEYYNRKSPSYRAEDDDEENDDEEGDEEDMSSIDSEDTATLLDRAHDRLHLQDLQDEVQHLKEIIAHKNEELEKLSGQLRRAVATKCDLVLAHNELELHHEQNLKRRDEGLMQLKRANLSLVEAQSEVEKDLLNEIFALNHKMSGLEEVHQRDVQEREEMHKYELSLKDKRIHRLQEEIRKMRSNAKKQAPPVSLPAFLKK